MLISFYVLFNIPLWRETMHRLLLLALLLTTLTGCATVLGVKHETINQGDSGVVAIADTGYTTQDAEKRTVRYELLYLADRDLYLLRGQYRDSSRKIFHATIDPQNRLMSYADIGAYPQHYSNALLAEAIAEELMRRGDSRWARAIQHSRNDETSRRLIDDPLAYAPEAGMDNILYSAAGQSGNRSEEIAKADRMLPINYGLQKEYAYSLFELDAATIKALATVLTAAQGKDCRADMGNLLIGRQAQDSICATLAAETGKLVTQLISHEGLRSLDDYGLVISLVRNLRSPGVMTNFITGTMVKSDAYKDRIRYGGIQSAQIRVAEGLREEKNRDIINSAKKAVGLEDSISIRGNISLLTPTTMKIKDAIDETRKAAAKEIINRSVFTSGPPSTYRFYDFQTYQLINLDYDNMKTDAKVYYVAVPEQKVGASCAIINEQLYFSGKQVKNSSETVCLQ